MGVEKFGTWQLFERIVIDAQGEQEKRIRNGESPSEVQWASTHTQEHTCGNEVREGVCRWPSLERGSDGQYGNSRLRGESWTLSSSGTKTSAQGRASQAEEQSLCKVRTTGTDFQEWLRGESGQRWLIEVDVGQIVLGRGALLRSNCDGKPLESWVEL